jgi:flagellar basal body-associated protein FliL
VTIEKKSMKLLLKIIVVAGVTVVGISIIVVVNQARQSHKKIAQPAGELPTAISNYSRTFKLNTTTPLWSSPTNGTSSTN